VAIAFDYKSNVELYPDWQAWLRENIPPTLLMWGRHDPFFPEPGARAYLDDLPDADWENRLEAVTTGRTEAA